MIDKLIGILQGSFLVYVAWYGYAYYTGRVGYSGKQEEKRQERVRKYRWAFIVSMLGALLSGILLIFARLIELAYIISK
jgi:hypothetical protein